MSDAAQPEAGQSSAPGTLVGGRFRIEKKIAAGGMGVVYRAVQEPLGRPVALKVLRKPQDPRLDETYSQRFLQEAAVVANLNHPNTIVVHDYGNKGGVLYFAMEYVDGLTLSEHIRKNGPLSPEEGVHVAKQIASSLLDAHAAGLVHRDLKPGNVMLLKRSGDPLFVKVLDFGLVKLADGDGGDTEKKKKLTQSGILMGSPRYMAPEQVRGKDVDARTDIYSFGALICFILTGEPPFSAGSQFEAMRAHVHTAAPALKDLAPTIDASPGLEAVVAKCLAKEPDARFANMSDLLGALETLTSETRVSVPNPRPAPPDGAPPENTNSSMTSFLTQAIVSPGKSKAKWVARVVLMGLVVAAGVALALMIPRGDPAPELVATTLPPLEAVPLEPAEETQEEVQEEVAPDIVEPLLVRVSVTPRRATILRDGVVLGTGEVSLPIPDGEEWELLLRAAGYEARRVTVTSQSRPLELSLDEEEEEEEEDEGRAPPDRRGMQQASGMDDSNEPENPTEMLHSTIRDPWAE